MPRRFLLAQWRTLLMLNFEVEPGLLLPRLPRGVELDAFHGRTIASMVGFMFLDTRVKGLRVPCHVDFEEVNLRFYVRRRATEGWRRGVVFVKELVPRAAIALVARRLYDEPYLAVPMRHTRCLPTRGGPGSVAYEWRTGDRWNSLSARFEGDPEPPKTDSEAEFITEHYWGYTARGAGRTDEYRVDHPPWRVWKALEPVFHADIETLYGREFVAPLQVPPTSAFVAEGSVVEVHRGDRLE